MNRKRVVVGMSGGVDSSVAAKLLIEDGFDVVGLFMHNWDDDFETKNEKRKTKNDGWDAKWQADCSQITSPCSSALDWEDARAVCGKLGIPCYSVNFSAQYMERVFSYFLDEYKKGRTPNPDVLCNREIKFGPFREYAERLGAEYIATGHYCGLAPASEELGIRSEELRKAIEQSVGADALIGPHFMKGVCADGPMRASAPTESILLKARDQSKDQTYFLNQVRTEQLNNVIFPLANLLKSEVRAIAEREGLVTARKKDSTGICFIGERKFKEFLKTYLPAQKGDIVDGRGQILGMHEGLMYYTLGQRKGFGLGGVPGSEANRWYVVGKDLDKNRLIVSNGEGEELFSSELTTRHINYIGSFEPGKEYRVTAKCRYRQPEQPCTVFTAPGRITVRFDTPQRAVTPGQYVVLYQGNRCLGGGVIE
ncbi:MAG: tRNA 2-thiouridine(34) synthase MnmA [Firmicutes bacterium]|nr:tRNA 2-thiouridine(34) synthase MnmA [Bacillota bacterium]